MRTTHNRPRSSAALLCCLLSYTLAATSLAPPTSRADAPAGAGRGARKTPVRAAARAARVRADAPRREGELLVRFRAGASEQGKDQAARGHGARRKGGLRGGSGAERLELRPGQDPAAVAEQLRARPDVEMAEPNFLVARDQLAPDDPRFSEQWALANTGQVGGSVGSDIRAQSAWRLTTGTASTVVAVVDGGVDFSHPDLRDNVWTNPAEAAGNGLDDDRDGYADDVNGWDWVADSGVTRDEGGHGTAVAGLIAAQGDNAEGVAGVMWRASLMSLRVLDSAGTGDVASAVEAIDYAAAHGAAVVNCSWGTDAESQLLREAIERAGRRGVVVVASAGNGGRDLDAQPYYPAAYDLPNLIAVGSTDGFDNLAPFSNWGAAGVAVAAPGVGLLTTQAGGGYTWVTGTSASAPLVTGIAGLVKTLRPKARAAAVRAAVTAGARKVEALAGRVSSGGVANAAGALAASGGNPYPDAGEGGSGNGQGGGEGPGNGQGYVPAAMRHDNGRARAKGHGGLMVDPPAAVRGAPGANLPNLDESRKVRHSSTAGAQAVTIQANLACADCANNFDAATSGGGAAPVFDDNPLAAGQTKVQARHVTQLRDAINSLRAQKGVAAYAWQTTAAPGALIKADPIIEMRAALDGALGAPATPYSAGLAPGQPIKAIHVQELRDRVRGAWDATRSDPYFGTARALEANETGEPGVTPGSGNFNWGLPLVSLPGRAGLDLTLALYYNSLVWTKQGTAIQYNADHGTPAPGFQLGLPRLQGQYFNSQVGAFAYTLITPSGGRVEMRLNDAGFFESADGSYTQLILTGSNNVPEVRASDGTRYVFGVAAGGERRCTLIQDRNGNRITATYHATNGHLQTVTDTLDRVVTFTYLDGGSGNLEKITQRWGGVERTYATFVYDTVTISPNFTGVSSILGVPSGSVQTVLSYVTFANNESYHFDYNSYGQVYQIRRKAPDGHELEHTRYDLSNADLQARGAQADCPRFTERYEYAQEWNGGAEVKTAYSLPADVTFTHPSKGVEMTGKVVTVTTPDGTVYKEYSRGAGWDEGLTQLTEVWLPGESEPAKKTCYVWTQDDENLSFTKNPRLIETNVYDSENNRRRTTISYGQGYRLPTEVVEWAGANGDQMLRRTVTSYRLEAAYLNNRIIGLVGEHVVYDPAGKIMSRAVYVYDSPGSDGADPYLSALSPSTGHASPGVARGNLTEVWRYNCDTNTTAYDNGQATRVVRQGYDMAGSVVWTKDALGHKTAVSYADSFSDGLSRNTRAYPTRVTDADGYSSDAQYNYDFGAVTQTTMPTSGTAGGAITAASVSIQYDSFGRLEQVTNLSNGAYRKWVTSTDGSGWETYRELHTYETIRGTAQADEFHSWQVFDGAGRVTATAADHPGSDGRYSGTYIVYDKMGRASELYKPTEMDGAWAASGGDVWSKITQTYDWQGRRKLTTNPDGSTRLLDYAGCGCAGGEVTTAQDEHGRRKRFTKDVFGRLEKVEELNWDGSPYSTTQYTYDALDRLKVIDQQGLTRSLDYDGHGRLKSRTTPEQGTTAFSYFADDVIQAMTDARGATRTFGYNGRHLVTSIEYGVPSGVAATPNVSFAYDAAGNRTRMTERDGNSVVGESTYHYDGLSRMDWEERTFPGVGTFRLTYDYNEGGELTLLKNHWGAEVTYSYDTAGRPEAVKGANYFGVTKYAEALRYSAFDALKGMNYSNGRVLSAAYDERMRPKKWDVAGVQGYSYNYDYFNERTGRVSYAQNLYDPTLDRSYEYDHLGRLTIAHAGAEARAAAFTGQWGQWDGPYSQGYEYDVWGNLTRRYGWGGQVLGGEPQGSSPPNSTERVYRYANNRRTEPGFEYDAAGNLTFDGGQHFTYDAAGRQTASDWTNLRQGYDGDGLRVRKSDDSTGPDPVYYLRSSVLGGQVVAELNSVGGWQRGYVYAGSNLLAVQQGGVYFVHEDPVTKSKRVTNMSGAEVSGTAVELDPFGVDTNRSGGVAFQPKRFTSYERDFNGTDEAMFRRYNRWHARFDQPDPYDGSYDLADPQSFNRYSYTNNDPVNFTDPTGLLPCYDAWCGAGGISWGGGYMGGTGWGGDPRPGRGIIEEGERQSDPFYRWTNYWWHDRGVEQEMPYDSMFGGDAWGGFHNGPKPRQLTPREEYDQRVAQKRKDCIQEALRLHREESKQIPTHTLGDALPTWDDWGGELVGAGGGAAYKLGRAAKVARTARIAAAASGGIAGIGFGLAGDFLWKLGSNSIKTARAADEVHYRYKARYKHCTEAPAEKL